MPQYVYLLRSDANVTPDALEPEAIEAIYRRYKDWSEGLARAGRLAGGQKLVDGTGRVLVGAAAKKVLVKDGPYVETKEVLGGFFAVDARDYAEAVALAQDCPHLSLGGSIEVREVGVCPGEAAEVAAAARATA